MKKNIYVKPVGKKWGVFEMTPPESFFDDWRHFGFRVAVYNIACLYFAK